MEFKKWLEDAGITHDDYVNDAPYTARGVKSKFRAVDKPNGDAETREQKRLEKKVCKFGNIDSKLR